MDKFQAYDNFWNGFNLIAYDQSTVPDDAELPYITYSVSENDLNHPVSVSASIWYRSKRWDNVSLKLEEVSNRIGRGGVMIPFDDGSIWIKKGTPFAQRMSDPNDSIRRISMNLEVEFID